MTRAEFKPRGDNDELRKQEFAVLLKSGIFMIFWIYLVIHGYPISHDDIGSSSSHNLDNMMSGLSAVAAFFGVFLTVTGPHSLSMLNLVLAPLTLAVVSHDMWVNGGAACMINRLTDEMKVGRQVLLSRA